MFMGIIKRDKFKQIIYLISGLFLLLFIIFFMTQLQVASIRKINKLNKDLKLIGLNYIERITDGEPIEPIQSDLRTFFNTMEFKAIIVSNPYVTLDHLLLNIEDSNLNLALKQTIEVIDIYEGELLKSFKILIYTVSALMMILTSLMVIRSLENYKLSIREQLKKEADRQLIEYMEKEKNYISLDLHDDIGQKLIAIKQHLQDYKVPLVMNKYIEEVIDKIRTMSHSLRGPELTKSSFYDQLQLLCSDFTSISTIQLQPTFLGLQKLNLTQNKTLHTYRIIQELITNTLKHSKATQIRLKVIYVHPKLKLSYEDNGIAEINQNKSQGLGLKSIKYRINIMHAQLKEISINDGFTMKIEIPVE